LKYAVRIPSATVSTAVRSVSSRLAEDARAARQRSEVWPKS
jgi:hypothetical protein